MARTADPLRGKLVIGLREFAGRVVADDVLGLSAEMAFRFLFATFPFLVFVASLGGFVTSLGGVADPAGQVITSVERYLPSDLVDPLRRQLTTILAHREVGLLSVGAVLTVIGAAGAISSLMKATNRALGVHETRPLAKRMGLAVVLTVVGGTAVVAVVAAILGGMLVTRDVVDSLGWTAIWPVVSLLRWPLSFSLLVAVGAAMLRFAPAIRPAWRTAFAGAAFAAGAWLAVTFGLGVYVARLADFRATYGALAGVIVLMIWYYLSALALLLSVELVAFLAQSSRGGKSSVGGEIALGRRGSRADAAPADPRGHQSVAAWLVSHRLREGHGRVWYCVDGATSTVWVTLASMGPPRPTHGG